MLSKTAPTRWWVRSTVHVFQAKNIELVLASQSAGRAAILKGAGLDFSKRPADIDERAVEAALRRDNDALDPADIAEVLAIAKAEHVSAAAPGAYVIGADQVLALDGEVFEKPKSTGIARENLLRFRGRSHQLHAAICVVKDGEILWRHVSRADLTMRDFTPEFLGRYLAAAGDEVFSSVGAYRLESVGIHLFDDIEGDYFTILGLPLLPLLAFLRSAGVLQT